MVALPKLVAPGGIVIARTGCARTGVAATGRYRGYNSWALIPGNEHKGLVLVTLGLLVSGWFVSIYE